MKKAGGMLAVFLGSAKKGSKEYQKRVEDAVLYALTKAGFFEKAVFAGKDGILDDLQKLEANILEFLLPNVDLNFIASCLQRHPAVFEGLGAEAKIGKVQRDQRISSRSEKNEKTVPDFFTVMLWLKPDNVWSPKTIEKEQPDNIPVCLHIENSLNRAVSLEWQTRMQPFVYALRALSPSSHMAGILFTLLCPAFTDRSAGKMLWTLVRLLAENVPLNLEDLNQMLMDAGKSDRIPGREELLKKLGRVFDEMDYAQAEQEMLPLVSETVRSSLSLWSPEFFHEILSKLVIDE